MSKNSLAEEVLINGVDGCQGIYSVLGNSHYVLPGLCCTLQLSTVLTCFTFANDYIEMIKLFNK